MKENRLENFAGRGAGLSGPALFPAYLYSGGHSYAAKGDPARRFVLCRPGPGDWLRTGRNAPYPHFSKNDVGNYFSPTVVAAAITSRRDKTHLLPMFCWRMCRALPLPPCCCWSRYGRLTAGDCGDISGRSARKKLKEIDSILRLLDLFCSCPQVYANQLFWRNSKRLYQSSII